MTSKAPESINNQSSNVPSSPSGMATDKKLLNRYGEMKHKSTEDISGQIYNIVQSHFEQLLKDGYDISDVIVASDYLQTTISFICSYIKLKYSAEVQAKERKIS